MPTNGYGMVGGYIAGTVSEGNNGGWVRPRWRWTDSMLGAQRSGPLKKRERAEGGKENQEGEGGGEQNVRGGLEF